MIERRELKGGVFAEHQISGHHISDGKCMAMFSVKYLEKKAHND